MKQGAFKTNRPFAGGLQICLVLLSVSVVGWLAGCGGSSSSGSSGNTGNTGPTNVSSGTWTWEGGDNVANKNGTYGTLGTAASSNIPGGRVTAVGWSDTSGNFWLFGGEGYDSAGTANGNAYLNDLWKYSPGTGDWTWMGGSSTANKTGTYGTEGTAAAGNVPGARDAPTSWTDASGNFWLFGGFGYDSQGDQGRLNDLWKYSPSSGEWTWVAGSGIAGQAGQYGTQGTAAAGNSPGGRNHPLSWIDAQGSLWLFGGIGCDSADDCGNFLNDLWKFDPTTSQWAWMSGSKLNGQDGTYGTKGTAAASNVPGARNVVMGWIDASGNLWLFGGLGADSVGSGGGDEYLNDLWKYSPSSGQWTWESGSNMASAEGDYGVEGTAAAGNMPGARWGASTWIDSSGNLWLFGGLGVTDAFGDTDEFSDVWEYNPGSGQWTWKEGANTAGHNGTYGSEGTASSSNLPGGRERGVTWIHSSGNVWIFGGEGYDSVGTSGGSGYMNDLWKYEP
jgi:hypothetical protein